MARGGAMVTRFGAFYDSTLDRVGDGATFIGIGAFLMTAPDVAYRTPAVIVCMVAILSSLLVSYARARAEGLGLDCKVGIAQRAERILGSGVASLVFGAGPHALLLETIVALLALASVITVVQRFVYVHQHAGRVDQALRSRKSGTPRRSSAPRRSPTPHSILSRKDRSSGGKETPGRSRRLKGSSGCCVWGWVR